MARTIQSTNKDITGEESVRDEAKLCALKEDYQGLLKFDFSWYKNSLDNPAGFDGSAIFFTENMVTDAIKKMKERKAEGPSGIIIETIKACRREIVTEILELLNQTMYEGNIPEDWKDSFIINCYKEKGDTTDGGNYSGLNLLEHLIKVIENVLKSYLLPSQAQAQYYRCYIRPSRNA